MCLTVTSLQTLSHVPFKEMSDTQQVMFILLVFGSFFLSSVRKAYVFKIVFLNKKKITQKQSQNDAKTNLLQ